VLGTKQKGLQSRTGKFVEIVSHMYIISFIYCNKILLVF